MDQMDPNPPLLRLRMGKCEPVEEDPVGHLAIRLLVLGQTLHQGAVHVS